MELRVGQAVKRADHPHGVITEVRTDGVTVAWHAKNADGTARAVRKEGTLREPLGDFVPDTRCPDCDDFFDRAK
jgi:hypothetical protein